MGMLIRKGMKYRLEPSAAQRADMVMLACGVDAVATTCTRKGQAPCLRQFLTNKNLLLLNSTRNPRPLGRGGCQLIGELFYETVP